MRRKSMWHAGWLALLVVVVAAPVWAGIPGFMKARMGSLSGQVYVDGKVLPNAVVSFFDKKGGPPPVIGSARRVPDMVTRTDDAGRFVVKLLPGSFYMGALIRPKGDGPGPPRPGEKYFFMKDEQGALRTFTVKTKQLTSAGRIDGAKPETFTELNSFITIKGRLLDRQGKGLAGMFVTLKEDPQAPRPKYISAPSAKDGSYLLKVPPGSYYVMARETVRGGRPRQGTYIGTYGKEPPALEGRSYEEALTSANSRGGTGAAKLVSGAAGEVISGIDIKMFKIPDPEATRRHFEEKARARKDEKAK